MNLKGQIAVVTGGASGIGRSIAVLLAHRGATVMVADVDEKAAKATSADLEAISGRSAMFAVDVTDPEGCESNETDHSIHRVQLQPVGKQSLARAT